MIWKQTSIDYVPSVNLPGLYSIIPATFKDPNWCSSSSSSVKIRDTGRIGITWNVETFGHCEALFTWKIFKKKKKLKTFKMGIFHPIGKRKKSNSKLWFLFLNLPSKIIPKLEFDMFRANSAIRNQAFPASCAEIPICPMFGSVASNEIYKHVLNHVRAFSRWNWQICKLFIAIWNVNYILLNVRLLKTTFGDKIHSAATLAIDGFTHSSFWTDSTCYDVLNYLFPMSIISKMRKLSPHPSPFIWEPRASKLLLGGS